MTATALARRTRVLFAACALAAMGVGNAGAQSTGFDLAGPSLTVSVTHGGVTLPLSQVPNLAVGDRVRVAVDLPRAQGARYRLVLAFLRGATNPPPKDWLFDAEPWKAKKATIDATVPTGAEQAIVLLVPDTGGALDAVSSAIRGRPGAFVRASQELNQAMLDRARLETFIANVTHRDPAELADVSPQLARSLAVKLDTDCLLRQPDARAACLTQSSNAAVLADAQTSSIAQTLAGTPADIALQLSSTPQAGYGYYSPYIGVIRDVVRLFGAFQSAQLQFIPALGVQHDASTALLLNTVPSFRKPQSVLVAALPGVAAPILPPLSARVEGALCASRPGLLLPVAGAPLVFATRYARDLSLRVKSADGQVREVPLTIDPVGGGFVVSKTDGAFGPSADATVHGLWGYQPFEGPTFRLVATAGRTWRVADDATLIVGRETPLRLVGGAAPCVTRVVLEQADGAARPVAWTAADADSLSLKVPLADATPGPVTLALYGYGSDQPQRLALRTFAESSRIAGFDLHAGDRQGVLTGTRLDQVASLDMAGVLFRPGALERSGTGDRLPMVTDMADVGAFQPKQAREAKVTLRDGRQIALKVTIGAPRPQATLVAKSVERVGPAPALPIALTGDDLVPQDARLTFSLRVGGDARLSPGDAVEVTASDASRSVTVPLQLQDAEVGIASLVPATALGASAHGALRFRLLQGGVAGPWQPLATLVRLPTLTAWHCPKSGSCTLTGDALFLIRSIASGGQSVPVPDGFTGASIPVPAPADGTLRLTLRDTPQPVVTVRLAP